MRGKLHHALLFEPSYESPCGVMRVDDNDEIPPKKQLRIPMWGYEDSAPIVSIAINGVTNPHVGL